MYPRYFIDTWQFEFWIVLFFFSWRFIHNYLLVSNAKLFLYEFSQIYKVSLLFNEQRKHRVINRQWRVASTIFDLLYVSSPFFFLKHLNYANCGQNIRRSKWNLKEHLLCFSLEEILESAKNSQYIFYSIGPMHTTYSR